MYRKYVKIFLILIVVSILISKYCIKYLNLDKPTELNETGELEKSTSYGCHCIMEPRTGCGHSSVGLMHGTKQVLTSFSYLQHHGRIPFGIVTT